MTPSFSLRSSQSLCGVLIDRGADIHAPDCDGDTPLTLAESPELKQHMTGQQIQSIKQKQSIYSYLFFILVYTVLFAQCQQAREQSIAIDNESATPKEQL